MSDAELDAIAVAAAVAAACYLRLLASYHATRHDNNVVVPVKKFRFASCAVPSHTPELTYPTVIV